ncbi:minor capsid protein [Paenibacillus glucanolyticus]|uniref:phage head morphogenesis protein n=1 Tax=Paenibacillus glucanolyticus TaxID=59843 RepID=UPI0035E2AC5F
MSRRRRTPPTRFPNAIAVSYARSISKLIQEMHSITYEAFRTAIVAEAKNYRSESVRADGVLDVILSALEYARSRTSSFVFTTSKINKVASDFVRRVNFFNKKNIDDQLFDRVRGINPTDHESWLDSFMRATVAENTTYIQSIREEYHKRVESIVLQGVKNGSSIPDMASEIKKASDVSYSRAKFIARDQTGSILGQMTAKRHQAAGVDRFRWSTSGDERVRAEHAAYDGNVYSYSEGAGPRGLTPGRDYNCRCVAEPIFDDEETE